MKTQHFALTKLQIWKITKFSILPIYLTLRIITATDEYNYEEISQRGIALLNHTYKSVYTEDYPSCLMSCMHDSHCKSFNYWWHSSKCDLNNRTKYSAAANFLKWDVSTTYMGLTREPEINRTVYRSCRHVHPSNGDGEYLIDPTLSGNPFTVYCDMTTDGGWRTRILSNYRNHQQTLTATTLLQLRNELGFNQMRFYCHKKNVGTVLHIMTRMNPLGEAVVNYFLNESLAPSRPQTCGSYTVLPDDNSTLSKDCTKLGENGTHADGKWAKHSKNNINRIQKPLFSYEDYHRLRSSPGRRDCDDWASGEDSLSPGDTWAAFVR
ncbi:hypothetical protein ACROYT_G015718 [Oculina patagonica]